MILQKIWMRKRCANILFSRHLILSDILLNTLMIKIKFSSVNIRILSFSVVLTKPEMSEMPSNYD